MFKERKFKRTESNSERNQQNHEQTEVTKRFEYPVDQTKLRKLRSMPEVKDAIGGNEKWDLRCICEILGGTQAIDEPFEYKRVQDQDHSEKRVAETAFSYLQDQNSLEALRVAASMVDGLPDNLQTYV